MPVRALFVNCIASTINQFRVSGGVCGLGVTVGSAMEFCNVPGEMIYSKHLNSKQETVNCKLFSSGVYFVIVADNEKRFVGKFVKE